MKIERLRMTDGCELRVRSISDNEGGLPIVMWGGMFGTYLIWSQLASALREKYSLLMIDYPDWSGTSPLFFNNEVSIPRMAEYQAQVMARKNISRAIVVGWSYGTQVALEFAGQNPSATAALVVMNGVAGNPFQHLSDPIFESIGIRPKLSQTVGWLTKKEESLSRLRRMIKKNEHPSRWAKRLGLVAPGVDELVMDAIIRDFIDIPAKHYNYYLQISVSHDAKPYLKTLDTPVLAVSGNMDKLVPAKRTREFVRKKPTSEFLLVKGGTHFLPLEYATLLVLKFEDFIARNNVA
ncbi:MAG: alpha/beta hydrolase [Deltaproteobacteria bacterium]|nr:alpha/beta hydrolase [Deltaproteobacteria bacterium]MBN2674072.1 alpha/beta hydrolase [Deltaproteobacteria bacterium]